MSDLRRLRSGLGAVAVLAVSAGATGCNQADNFTAHEWEQIQQLEPLKGAPPRNPYNLRDQDEDAAKLGQMLFFEKELAEAITVAGPSGNVGDLKKVACVNCHDTPYFTDSHMTSPGAFANNGLIPGLSHGRNYLSTNGGQLTNLHWNEWALWAGRFDSLVEHGTGVWGTSATVMAQARFLYAKYEHEWNAVFPDNQLDPRLGLPTTDPANIYPADGQPARHVAGGRPRAHQSNPGEPGPSLRHLPADAPHARLAVPALCPRPRPRCAVGRAEAGPQALHRQGRLQRLPQRPDAHRQPVPQHRRAEHHDDPGRHRDVRAQPRTRGGGGGKRHQPECV